VKPPPLGVAPPLVKPPPRAEKTGSGRRGLDLGEGGESATVAPGHSHSRCHRLGRLGLTGSEGEGGGGRHRRWLAGSEEEGATVAGCSPDLRERGGRHRHHHCLERWRREWEREVARREEGRGAWTSGAEREVARARSGAEKGEARPRGAERAVERERV